MIGRTLISALVAVTAMATTTALSQDFRQPAPKGASVYFIAPANGETITGPVTIKFGLKGMGVAPAGVEKAGTGHHHVLVDTKLQDYKAAIPADAKHVHFGGGQTETSLTLAPGQHTLQLLVGDQNHIPHNPPIESEVITITVK